MTVLFTPYDIVSLCKSEAIPNITAHDIILIQNLIFSSESLRHTESWVPICLPGISDAGYLQLYSHFYEKDIGLVFITQSQEHSFFLQFADQSRIIFELAVKENLMENIKAALVQKEKNITSQLKKIENYTDEKLFDDFYLKLQQFNVVKSKELTFNDAFEEVRYIVCKHKQLNQIFAFRFNDFDKTTEEEKQILISYTSLYDVYNQQNLNINTNNFFHYDKSERFTHVIQTTENYMLFSSFNLFKEFDEINNLTTEILKVIKMKESYFFINKY